MESEVGPSGKRTWSDAFMADPRLLVEVFVTAAEAN